MLLHLLLTSPSLTHTLAVTHSFITLSCRWWGLFFFPIKTHTFPNQTPEAFKSRFPPLTHAFLWVHPTRSPVSTAGLCTTIISIWSILKKKKKVRRNCCEAASNQNIQICVCSSSLSLKVWKKENNNKGKAHTAILFVLHTFQVSSGVLLVTTSSKGTKAGNHAF